MTIRVLQSDIDMAEKWRKDGFVMFDHSHPRLEQILAMHRHEAMIEGVKLGLAKASSAVLAAQYDPAPWCKATEIIKVMDADEIVRKGLEGRK